MATQEAIKNPPPTALQRHIGMLRVFLPQLPLIVRVALAHALNLSETAPYLDLRSAVIVAVLRSMCAPGPSKPISVSKIQKLSVRDAGVKGRIWVSTYASPVPPEDGAREALGRAMASLMPRRDYPEQDGIPDIMRRVPECTPVEAEWTGYRAGAGRDDPPPAGMSERSKYDALMKECGQPTTILYLHGGACFLLDPASHRPTTKKLAKLTSGRCYSVRYRLAPKHPFPAALLDAFVSYLTLLYPPPDAYHEPVRPEHIVFAGDSAGGNLSMSLLQLLLELRRLGQPVSWHGEERRVPLPAAVACNSPWMDVTSSSPAFYGDAPYVFDYIPKPAHLARNAVMPCDIWPANPPREHLYVTADLADHPLTSPITAGNWDGAPPVYMCTGWELLAWEVKVAAKRLAVQGVPVVFEEYEAMPHCFAMVLTETSASRRCFAAWSSFIRAAVANPISIAPRATYIKAKTLDEEPLRFDNLGDVSLGEIRDQVKRKANDLSSPMWRVAKL
ncbi:hypothetical protein HIM_05945 [Hirsutella minnesotensis 3608]|uniref:Alpha/beta hydrolase fold-3 domain-containing protein n=1 Tax=Hirsutella minnesotensis 3608 TaxID=1043627 RepID=A0A0F7ZNZ2_9HYPO|nr:hypothetical protein HIM_05945 [Hirsutella minnesotensis 3608]